MRKLATIIYSNEPYIELQRAIKYYSSHPNWKQYVTRSKPIAVLDIRNGNVLQYPSITDFCIRKNIKDTTIVTKISNGLNLTTPIDYYFIQYQNDLKPWPNLNGVEINYYCKKASGHLTREDYIRFQYSYNPLTGIISYRNKYNTQIKSTCERTATCINVSGYLNVYVLNTSMRAHIVAWFLYHGEWPSDTIDHKNGIRSDNRMSNLRVISKQQNCQNRQFVKGYWLASGKNKYMSEIRIGDKRIYLGRFQTSEKAREAYFKAKRKYHPGFNH